MPCVFQSEAWYCVLTSDQLIIHLYLLIWVDFVCRGNGMYSHTSVILFQASPNRPAWEIGESRKRCLSDSLISTKVSHRWRSWTTNVDIVWPRARAVTFVALSARSVTVRSSCNTPGSASPSCSCFNALAWWTCRRAMACRAEAACPAAP